MAQDESFALTVRLPRETHDALLDRQREVTAQSGVAVTLPAVVRALIDEALGLKKKAARK